MFIYVFITGLIMAQYTITGFDASAHMSEETRKASLGAAWGMVMAVVVSVIFGFILLVAVTFAIPERRTTISSRAGRASSPWSGRNRRVRGWAEFMLFIAVVAQTFCTIASVTSASRMMFAFSRDGAVPGHRIWRRVSKAERVPIYSVWAICDPVVRADDPDALERVRRLRRRHAGLGDRPVHRVRAADHPALAGGESFQQGAWHLGRTTSWIDWAAIIWIAFIAIAFVLPFASTGIPGNDGFTWDFFNYTGSLVGGAFLLFGGWYVLSARKWFKGPVARAAEEELEAIERQYETPAASAPDAGELADRS